MKSAVGTELVGYTWEFDSDANRLAKVFAPKKRKSPLRPDEVEYEIRSGYLYSLVYLCTSSASVATPLAAIVENRDM